MARRQLAARIGAEIAPPFCRVGLAVSISHAQVGRVRRNGTATQLFARFPLVNRPTIASPPHIKASNLSGCVEPGQATELRWPGPSSRSNLFFVKVFSSPGARVASRVRCPFSQRHQTQSSTILSPDSRSIPCSVAELRNHPHGGSPLKALIVGLPQVASPAWRRHITAFFFRRLRAQSCNSRHELAFAAPAPSPPLGPAVTRSRDILFSRIRALVSLHRRQLQ